MTYQPTVRITFANDRLVERVQVWSGGQWEDAQWTGAHQFDPDEDCCPPGEGCREQIARDEAEAEAQYGDPPWGEQQSQIDYLERQTEPTMEDLYMQADIDDPGWDA